MKKAMCLVFLAFTACGRGCGSEESQDTTVVSVPAFVADTESPVPKVEEVQEVGLPGCPTSPYSFKYTGEDNAFTCVPCEDDSECNFKHDTFCQSSYGPPTWGPVFMFKPTGKCQTNHTCEFKKEFCSDGDLSTFHSCFGQGSPYPNLKAGKCESTQFTPNMGINNQVECWCATTTQMHCVKYVHRFNDISDKKELNIDCPNGCGPDCTHDYYSPFLN